jgi:predicted DNA-binding protein
MFTITVPDELEARLKVLATRYNAANTTDLTVPEFLDLHLVEMAVQEDLEKAFPLIQKARDEGFQADIGAERLRLIAGFRAKLRPAARGPLTEPPAPV